MIKTLCNTMYVCMYVYMYVGSYIRQTEQHTPEVRSANAVLSGNVTYLLDVTPNNLLPHLLSPPPIPLGIIQVQRFGC